MADFRYFLLVPQFPMSGSSILDASYGRYSTSVLVKCWLELGRNRRHLVLRLKMGDRPRYGRSLGLAEMELVRGAST